MKRREFIKKVAIVPVALSSPSFLRRCEPKITSPSNSFDDYVPNLNTNPYNEPNYVLQTKTTANGQIAFNLNGETHAAWVQNKYGKRITGLDSFLYHDKSFGQTFVVITDPLKVFMPKMYIPSGLQKKVSGSLDFITMDLWDEARSWGNSLVQKLDIDLPSWDKERIDDVPGFVYIGNWSFADADDVVTILKYGSLTLNFIAPGVGNAVYEVLAKVDGFIDNAEDMVKLMNGLGVFNFDIEQPYAIYVSPLHQPFLNFIKVEDHVRNSNVNFRDLFPLQQGNSWTYLNDSQTFRTDVEVLGTENIHGQEVVVLKDGGAENYVGYSGNDFKLVGTKYPELGKIFFDPAVKVGKDNLKIGDSLHSESKIIFEENPDQGGKVEETIYFEKKENIKTFGMPFGDCWKARDSYSLELTKKGFDTIYSDQTVERWYSKNAGPVKIKIPSYGDFYLWYSHVNSALGKNSSSERLKDNLSIFNGISKAVVKNALKFK